MHVLCKSEPCLIWTKSNVFILRAVIHAYDQYDHTHKQVPHGTVGGLAMAAFLLSCPQESYSLSVDGGTFFFFFLIFRSSLVITNDTLITLMHCEYVLLTAKALIRVLEKKTRADVLTNPVVRGMENISTIYLICDIKDKLHLLQILL